MKERVFLDTNVIVYADDIDAGKKNRIGRRVLKRSIERGIGVLSTQVLQEYFVVATRKLGVDPAIARRKLELLATLDVVEVTVPLILRAVDLHRLHSISFRDALIVQCAAAAGCARLLSEDLQHGAAIEGVRIEDPFREPDE